MWIWDGRLPLGLVSDNVWIWEGIDLDCKRRGKSMMLLCFIEE